MAPWRLPAIVALVVWSASDRVESRAGEALFPVSVGTDQIHDINPGIAPSGLLSDHPMPSATLTSGNSEGPRVDDADIQYESWSQSSHSLGAKEAIVSDPLRASTVPDAIPQQAPGGFAAAEPLPDLIRRIVREELHPIRVQLEELRHQSKGSPTRARGQSEHLQGEDE